LPEIAIRPFAWSDVPALTAIYAHYVRETVITFELEPPSEAAMAERFGRLVDLGHPLLVVTGGDRVLGYAYASLYRPRPAYRFTCENSIYLAADAVGRGIGGPLLERLLGDAAAAGFRQMIAVITAERANSIRLHARHGFREVGRYEAVGFKFERWLDIVHMQRAL